MNKITSQYYLILLFLEKSERDHIHNYMLEFDQKHLDMCSRKMSFNWLDALRTENPTWSESELKEYMKNFGPKTHKK